MCGFCRYLWLDEARFSRIGRGCYELPQERARAYRPLEFINEELIMRIDRFVTFILGLTLTLIAGVASAHCDTLDGPVVTAARMALDRGDVAPVLIWVQEAHEDEIRQAFRDTLAVRTLSAEAAELADRYFFETVVRLHREGEGAPYTGLKPAGTNFGPAIPAADDALESGSIEGVAELLTGALEAGLHKQFEEALSRGDFDPADISAGRQYISSYVEYIHYVERIYDAAVSPALHHFPEHE